MKPAYYWAAIVVVAIFVVGALVSRNANTPASPDVAQVSSDTTTNTGSPAVVSTRPAATPTSMGKLNISAIPLPTYYAQQIASTTLLIHVSAPASNTTVNTPLTVTGEARGTWFFEASFPIILTNAAGTILAQSHALAKSDWMTTEFVPFVATFAFPKQKSGSKGYLYLRNDNPSGLAKNDKAVMMEVIF